MQFDASRLVLTVKLSACTRGRRQQTMSCTPLSSSELTEIIAALNRVAHNLWWTWNQGAQEIFSELSPRSWQNLYHNAVAILHEVSDYELRVRLQDPEFCQRVRQVISDFDAYMGDKETWGRKNAPQFIQDRKSVV